MQVVNTPSAAETMPLSGSFALMEPTRNRPTAASRKSSAAPNLMTKGASSGMNSSMARADIMPPEKDAILEMSRASLALPFLAMG